MKAGANPAPRTVCVDFDGVLADYHGWKDVNTLDPPYPGALEFVERCLDEGYKVTVHTTRDPGQISVWLNAHKFPQAVEISIGRKPMASVYIDDRAWRFDGNWDEAFDAITQPPHWDKGTP